MAEQLKTQHPFRRVVSNRNFRLLWIGGSISVLGSQFSLIALPWLVLQLTGDPQVLGLVLALAGLSRAGFMLYGGVITDRFSPRRILLICDWINFLLSGLIAALVFTGNMQIWMIYLFSLVSGSISGFVIPAAQSMTPIITEKFAILEARRANELLESGQVPGNLALLTPELLVDKIQ